jgi:hypothetical protein
MLLGLQVAPLEAIPEDLHGLADRLPEGRQRDRTQRLGPGVVDGIREGQRLRVERDQAVRLRQARLDRLDHLIHAHQRPAQIEHAGARQSAATCSDECPRNVVGVLEERAAAEGDPVRSTDHGREDRFRGPARHALVTTRAEHGQRA